MTGMFTVCRDEPRHNVCTCANCRCCRSAQITQVSRARYFSVSLLRDVVTDDNSGNTIQNRRARPLGEASPLLLRCCPPAVVVANAACVSATEKLRPLLSGSLGEVCRESPSHEEKCCPSTDRRILPSDRRDSRGDGWGLRPRSPSFRHPPTPARCPQAA